MSLSIDRAGLDARMREVRTLLSLIKGLESQELPPVDTDEVKMLRGLFFVHLYGAFEKSVNEAFENYIRAVTRLAVANSHIELQFWPSAFDSSFKSLQAINNGGWKTRAKLVDAAKSLDHCVVNEAVLSDQLQNVWSHTVTTAIAYLGLEPIAWGQRESLYLDEVVDKRNQVAHGRTSPTQVGANGRAADLEVRLAALEALLDLLVSHFELQFAAMTFVKPEFRANYNGSTPRVPAEA